jgi:hypothetical protein
VSISKQNIKTSQTISIVGISMGNITRTSTTITL